MKRLITDNATAKLIIDYDSKQGQIYTNKDSSDLVQIRYSTNGGVSFKDYITTVNRLAASGAVYNDSDLVNVPTI